jgi:Cu/Ag efflux protein CusF
MEGMTRQFSALLLFLTLLLLAACHSSPEKAEPAKRFPMHGEIKALDANAKTATIDAGKIGDWMGPMTMEYPVKPDAEFQKLHVGDKIDATVVVADVKYYVTDIKVAPKP